MHMHGPGIGRAACCGDRQSGMDSQVQKCMCVVLGQEELLAIESGAMHTGANR